MAGYPLSIWSLISFRALRHRSARLFLLPVPALGRFCLLFSVLAHVPLVVLLGSGRPLVPVLERSPCLGLFGCAVDWLSSLCMESSWGWVATAKVLPVLSEH